MLIEPAGPISPAGYITLKRQMTQNYLSLSKRCRNPQPLHAGKGLGLYGDSVSHFFRKVYFWPHSQADPKPRERKIKPTPKPCKAEIWPTQNPSKTMTTRSDQYDYQWYL